MKRNIAFMTAGFIDDKFSSALKKIDSEYELKIFTYKDLNELVDIYKKNYMFLDGIILSGIVPYTTLMKEIDGIKTPMVYLKVDERDFYKQLFKILIENPNMNLSKIFIDFLRENNDYYGIYKLIGNNYPYTAHDFDLSNYLDHDDYEGYHKKCKEIHSKLWRENKIDISITRDIYTFEELKKRGYRCYYIVPSPESFISTYNELITRIDMLRYDNNKPVVCYITLKKSEYKEDDFGNKIEYKQTKLYNIVLDSLYKSDAHYIPAQQNGLNIELFSSKGELVNLTNHFRSCPITCSEDNIVSFKFNVGWGIGNTIKEAKINAQRANKECEKLSESCAFIITEDEKIIGPIGKETFANCDVVDNSAINEMSHSLSLSSANIKKINSIIKKLGTNEISSEVLSKEMGITVRSVNRILNKLKDGGVASLVYNCNDKERGRPKKIYKIDFSSINSTVNE